MKEILLIVSDKDIEETSDGSYTFYNDGTYRWSEWASDALSEWKIVENKLFVRHPKGSDDWIECVGKPSELVLTDMIQAEQELNKILEE